MLFSLLVQRIKRREPPSSALSFITACPVVPLPAKKSRQTAFLFSTNRKTLSISPVGLGVPKALEPKISFISLIALLVVPTSFPNHIVSGVLPSNVSKYILRIILVSSALNIISPVLIFSSTVSLLHLQPFSQGFIILPDGVTISYMRLGLYSAFLTSPLRHLPRGSLSGFEYALLSSSVLGKEFKTYASVFW